jgi:D-tyrosyl-tRNA(Tyr) deacylase
MIAVLQCVSRQGRMPSFEDAADAQKGAELFAALVDAIRATCIPTETGRFCADMQASLVNNGPATVILDSSNARFDSSS